MGFDSIQAHKRLSLKEDLRCYRDVLEILQFYKLRQIKLLTNNPKRIKFLENHGIKVKRVPLEAPLNSYNFKELVTKKEKMHHLLSLGAYRELKYEIIASGKVGRKNGIGIEKKEYIS
ncbi:MAG: hypothetical protein HQ555_08685 [Candidatus Aminicenantes bacterium]|nr:hypothetical protein [Candidatus Aminicenantes bacterium]